VAAGAEAVVCVGGDGTLNEVINGLRDTEGRLHHGVAIGIIPRGTGCDFIRSAPVPTTLSEFLDALLSRRTCTLDVGEVAFRDPNGRPSRRLFHNVVSFGIGGEVDERVNRGSKLLGGFLCFIWSTLVSLLKYQSKRLCITVDGQEPQELDCWNVAVANGQYHGGGMWVAPGARMDDGLFEITVIGNLSLPSVFWNLQHLYNGKIHGVKKVQRFVGRRIEVRSGQRVLIDLDGEQPGQVPATVEMLPKVLRVICR
jgi:YegS/Rv2252/BmrU family lipid kinase